VSRDGRALGVGTALVVLVGGALLLLLLWPDGESVRQLLLRLYLFGLHHGVPGSVNPDVYATVLNVVVFVPPGWLGVVLLRRRVLTVWLSLLAASAAVELVQALPWLGREASLLDVACNGAGALLGAVLGSATVRRRRRDDDDARVGQPADERQDPGAHAGR